MMRGGAFVSSGNQGRSQGGALYDVRRECCRIIYRRAGRPEVEIRDRAG